MLELGSLAASVQVCKNGYHWEKPSRKSKSGADMLLYCGASAAEQMKSTADDYRYYDPFRVAPALFWSSRNSGRRARCSNLQTATAISSRT